MPTKYPAELKVKVIHCYGKEGHVSVYNHI